MLIVRKSISLDELKEMADSSKQEFLWGINIYPENIGGQDWIEFDSMINLRPSQGNRSRLVESEQRTA